MKMKPNPYKIMLLEQELGIKKYTGYNLESWETYLEEESKRLDQNTKREIEDLAFAKFYKLCRKLYFGFATLFPGLSILMNFLFMSVGLGELAFFDIIAVGVYVLSVIFLIAFAPGWSVWFYHKYLAIYDDIPYEWKWREKEKMNSG